MVAPRSPVTTLKSLIPPMVDSLESTLATFPTATTRSMALKKVTMLSFVLLPRMPSTPFQDHLNQLPKSPSRICLNLQTSNMKNATETSKSSRLVIHWSSRPKLWVNHHQESNGERTMLISMLLIESSSLTPIHLAA